MRGWRKEGERVDPEKVTDENVGLFFLVLCVPDQTRSKKRDSGDSMWKPNYIYVYIYVCMLY